jgi:hypothetical protein
VIRIDPTTYDVQAVSVLPEAPSGPYIGNTNDVFPEFVSFDFPASKVYLFYANVTNSYATMYTFDITSGDLLYKVHLEESYYYFQWLMAKMTHRN